jgi:NodT family efflux transporter outer membrane factor (OMF) lipoprotein
MRLSMFLVAPASALLLAGCAVGVDPADRSLPVPSAWRAPAAGQGAADHADWWRRFGSPALDAVIAQAHAGNLDMAAAMARVGQAEAQARMAGALALPVLSAVVDANRQARLGGNAPITGSVYTGGFAASYEVDLWGRYGALRAESRHALDASAFDRDTVRLSATANTAAAWLEVLGARERIAIALQNLDNARRLLRLAESRARAGAATPLDLAQQRGLVATQERLLAALRRSSADAQTTLAVLLGEPASTFETDGPALAALHAPDINAGLPSQLLLRRPDIARAEAQLAAADASVVAARAAMLPALTLRAGAGWAASRPKALFDNPLYNLGAGLMAPIFDGGRLAGLRDLARARRDEVLAAYRAAIVSAVADAEGALNAVAAIDAQALAQREAVAQARRAAQLSEARYRWGAEMLLVSLDAQRTLYEAQDLEAQLQLARLQARVALFRALGGGWGTGPGDQDPA